MPLPSDYFQPTNHVNKSRCLGIHLGSISERITDNRENLFLGQWHAYFNEHPNSMLFIAITLVWSCTRDQIQKILPWKLLTAIHGQSVGLYIRWEPWEGVAHEQEGIVLQDLVAGRFDEEILFLARSLVAWNGPVLFNFAPGMNADNYPWDGIHVDTTGKTFISAYRHVINIFRQIDATNVAFAWTPEVCPFWFNLSGPHALEQYYPGDEYVDWVGLEGINYGQDKFHYSRWLSPEEMYRKAYERLIKCAPGKPVLLSRIASVEKGGSKVLWVNQLFKCIDENLQQVRMICWEEGDPELSIFSSAEARFSFFQPAI